MRITKETQAQLGPDRNVLAISLLQGETLTKLFKFEVDGVAQDITNFTYEFKFIRRLADYVSDTKNGINIVGLQKDPTAIEFDFTSEIAVIDAANGVLQFHIPNTLTSEEPLDPDSSMPIIYTGYLSVNDNAAVGPKVQKFPFLVLVSNDGVSL